MTLDDLNIHSTELARKLNSSADGASLRWTGWKGTPDVEGYCSQWLDCSQFAMPGMPNAKGYYVNLPGMQHGWYARGSDFEIGSERVTLETLWSEVAQLIVDGFKLLREKPE